MMVITEAAPGLVPHSAVVPGSICRRVISQPMKLDTATTDSTPRVNSGQWPRISPTIDRGTILAIMLPTTPCATTNGLSGKFTCPPLAATAIAASNGPSISAAGACSHSSSAARAADRTTRAAHCAGCDILLNELLRLAVHVLQRPDQLGGGRRQTCIIRAAQDERHARLAVAEGGIGADVDV